MLDLTWWQVLALAGSAAVAVFGGRLLGSFVYRLLYRRALLTRSTEDDRLVARLAGPLQAIGIVIVWHVAISFIELPASVIGFARAVGHVGLLLALGWGAMRAVDSGIEALAMRARWISNQRASQSLLPLARRLAKVVLGTVIAVMVVSQLGYAVGPLLVLLAIVGACLALAAHRPLENVLSAYAILGDHGIREGDTVTLDTGTMGTIQSIGLYTTRIRTLTGSDVIVPNRKLADAQIERSFQRAPTRPLASIPSPETTPAGGLS